MKPILLALCVALVALSGCRRGTAPDQPIAPAVDLEVAELIDAVGDRALMTVVIRPAALPALGRSLGPLLDALGPDAAPVRQALSAADALPAMLAGGPIAGWDTTRPMVLALFEPTTDDPIAAAAAVPADRPLTITDMLPPGLRHRALVPASDPAALVEALGRLAAKMGFEVRGDALVDGATRVRLFAEDGRVRIEASTRWRPADDAPSTARRSARTPAFLAVAGPGAPAVAVLVRTWQMRPVFTNLGLHALARAMAFAANGHTGRMVAGGWSMVLRSMLLMQGAGAEFDDWGFTLHPVETGVELRSTISLTPDGVSIFERGGRHPGLKLTRAGVAHLAFETDLRAMVDAAAEPAAFAQARGAGDVFRAFSECGPGCNAYVATRQPMGTLKGIARMAVAEGVGLAASDVRALQLVFVGFDGEKPQAAGAWQVPEQADLSAVRTLIAQAPRDPDVAFEMFTAPVGDGLLAVMVGLNIDPRTVFDATVDQVDGLARLSVRPAALGDMVPPALRPVTEVLTGLEVRSAVIGRAVAGTVRVGIGHPIDGPLAPRAAVAEWTSPIGHAPQTPATRCLERAMWSLAEMLDAVSRATPTTGRDLWATGVAELSVDLKCAEADAASAARVAALRRMLTVASIGLDDDPFSPAALVARLAPLCAAGAELACAEKARRAQQPAIALAPLAAGRCEDAKPYRQGRTLVVTADDARLDGERLPVEPAALRAILNEKAAAAEAERKTTLRDDTVRIGIGRDVRWSRVKPILEAVSAARMKNRLMVAGADGPLWWPVELAAPLDGARDTASRDRWDDGLAPLVALDPTIGGPESTPVVRFGVDAIAVSDAGPPEPEPEMGTRPDPDARLAEALARWPGQPVYFEPADDTPWARVVEVASRGCGRARLGLRPGTAPDHGARVEPGTRTSTPGRSQKVIRRIMQRSTKRVQSCYREGLTRDPDLAGRIVVELVVEPDGTVSRLKTTRVTLADPQVVECVRAELSRVKMPEAAEATTLEWPIVFEVR